MSITPFGQAGRAARVRQDREVVTVDGGRGHRWRREEPAEWRRRRLRRRRVADHDQAADTGALDRLARDLEARSDRDQQRAPASLSWYRTSSAPYVGLTVVVRPPARDRTVEHHRVLRDVRRHDPDDVPVTDPTGREAGRGARDAVDERAVRDAAAGGAVDERDSIRVVRRSFEHVRSDCDVGNLDVGPWTAMDDRRGHRSAPLPLSRRTSTVAATR